MAVTEWLCDETRSRGCSESARRQDLHEYDIALAIWTDLSSPSTGTPPSARTNMGLAHSVGKLYVFGGYDGIMPLPLLVPWFWSGLPLFACGCVHAVFSLRVDPGNQLHVRSAVQDQIKMTCTSTISRWARGRICPHQAMAHLLVGITWVLQSQLVNFMSLENHMVCEPTSVSHVLTPLSFCPPPLAHRQLSCGASQGLPCFASSPCANMLCCTITPSPHFVAS